MVIVVGIVVVESVEVVLVEGIKVIFMGVASVVRLPSLTHMLQEGV